MKAHVPVKYLGGTSVFSYHHRNQVLKLKVVDFVKDANIGYSHKNLVHTACNPNYIFIFQIVTTQGKHEYLRGRK